LLETENHDIGGLLWESLEHEKEALAAYYDLLKIAEGKSALSCFHCERGEYVAFLRA
jgi:bacterioferritin